MAEEFEPVDEMSRGLLFDAAEEVRALGGRLVAVTLPTDHRSLAPYVMELSASSVTIGYDHFAFCPLHQNPVSPVGSLGVEIGNVYVADKCPGRFVGLYHPEGDEAAGNWAVNNRLRLLSFLREEWTRTDREIRERDLSKAPGTQTLSEAEKEQIFTFWERYRETLVNWIEKIDKGDLHKGGE